MMTKKVKNERNGWMKTLKINPNPTPERAKGRGERKRKSNKERELVIIITKLEYVVYSKSFIFAISKPKTVTVTQYR